MNSRGNVLFIIFIAIALFAALSYAVMQSGGASDIDREKAEIYATELAQWFSSVQYEFNRMASTRKVYIDEYNVNPPGHGWQERCDDEDRCALWENLGGRARLFYIDDPAFYQNGQGSCTGVPTYADGPQSHALVQIRRIEGVGDDNLGDVYISIECVNEEVCRAINRQNGIDNANDIPTDSSERKQYNFSGVAAGDFPEPDSGTNSNVGDEDARLAGKTFFCHYTGSYGGTRTEAVMVLAPR